MIYVPDDLSYSACYTFYDSDTIRVYESNPELGSIINYEDIFINSHYLVNKGTEIIEEVPSCINSNQITSFWSYRNDLADILICISVFILFIYWCLSKPLRWLFRGWF